MIIIEITIINNSNNKISTNNKDSVISPLSSQNSKETVLMPEDNMVKKLNVFFIGRKAQP